MKTYHGIVFEDCGDPLTESLLKAYGYKANLPKDYAAFMRAINGGRPVSNAFSFVGIFGDLTVEHVRNFWRATAHNDWQSGEYFPKRMIQIAETKESSLIVLSLMQKDRGKIFHVDMNYDSDFTDPENIGSDNLSLLANSFDEFLGMLYVDQELINMCQDISCDTNCDLDQDQK